MSRPLKYPKCPDCGKTLYEIHNEKILAIDGLKEMWGCGNCRAYYKRSDDGKFIQRLPRDGEQTLL
jgi:uncharacterized protein with PIN domain